MSLLINPSRFAVAGGGGLSMVTELTERQAGGTTQTCSAFTPEDDSLLVVIATGQRNSTGAPTISDSETLTWTARANSDGGANKTYGAIWTTEISTGVSMTVSLANAFHADFTILSFTGYDTSTPVGANLAEGGANRSGAYSQSLSGTTAADSILVGIFGSSSVDTTPDATDMTPDGDYTEIFESTDGTYRFQSNSSYYEGSTSTFDMDNATGGNQFAQGWRVSAIEVQAA